MKLNKNKRYQTVGNNEKQKGKEINKKQQTLIDS